MLKVFWLLLKRDLLIAYRHRAEIANPLLFFVIAVSLFPLSVSPESSILRIIAPGVIWVIALLATMLALDNLFRADFEDGTLEQLLLSAYPLPLLVMAKVFAHWLITGLPLLLLAPLLGILLFLPTHTMPVLMLTLLLGTPVLSLVGAIGIALTVGLRQGGVLLSLLVLPLYVPVLIFATNAISVTAKGLPASGQLFALAGLLSLSLTLAPFTIAAALRISLS